MSRHMLTLAHEQLTSFDLDVLRTHADSLNQHHRDTFTTSLPKAPSRRLSHYVFTPRPLVLTREGDVDGGLSWLVGTTIDFSCTCSLCAPHYGVRGTEAWQHLYAARGASERPNSDDQEVIASAQPLRMRGLKALRFAGAIRTLAQLLRRALNFVLDVT